jgi:hypothetical protein
MHGISSRVDTPIGGAVPRYYLSTFALRIVLTGHMTLGRASNWTYKGTTLGRRMDLSCRGIRKAFCVWA